MEDEALFEAYDRYSASGSVMPDEPTSEIRDLNRFHIIDDKGRVRGVFDWRIFEYITSERDLFVLGGVLLLSLFFIPVIRRRR